jgi:hypothetical protein
LQVTAKLNSKHADPSGDHPDVQLFFGGYLANCAKTGAIGEAEDPQNPSYKRRISVSPVVLHPKSRGHVTLKSSNPLDPPLMYANYFTDPADMATMLDAIKITLRLGNTSVLKERFGFELDTTPIPSCVQRYIFGSDGYWECYARTATGPENHQVGSCRMGPSSDSTAVVDPELRVHGVKSLRIMDASIMPTVVSGNTNAPVIMIAEKGSDMIKKRWLQSDINSRFGFGSQDQKDKDNTFGHTANHPIYPLGHKNCAPPKEGGQVANNTHVGQGASQGHSCSEHGGDVTGGSNYSTQGFPSAGDHNSDHRHIHNHHQSFSNFSHFSNSDHGHAMNHSNGTGGHNTLPFKGGNSPTGPFPSFDRCANQPGGSNDKSGCNQNAGGNVFDFKYSTVPSPPSGNNWNRRQLNYWTPTKQPTKRFK